MDKNMRVFVEKFIKSAFKQRIENYPRTAYNYWRNPRYTGGASTYHLPPDSKEENPSKTHKGS